MQCGEFDSTGLLRDVNTCASETDERDGETIEKKLQIGKKY